MKNLMEKVENNFSKINAQYDMTLEDINTIYRNSTDLFNIISNSFCFGYMQGYKAALAEMKKKASAK